MSISDLASERCQELTISAVIPVDSLAQQIKICMMLEESASAIAKQFDFFTQFAALDVALSCEFPQHRPRTAMDSKAAPPGWTDFRDRLSADCLLLTHIASQARERLNGISAKRGRPVKQWRNIAISELVDRLKRLQVCTFHECIELANDLWNIYFPRETIIDLDAVKMIVRRTKKIRLNQGQKAVTTD